MENRIPLTRVGELIDVITDYHANGSYEVLKEHVQLRSQKDYALMVRTLNFERNDFKDDIIYVDKSAYEFLKKSKVKPDDILTNKIANPGSIYIMPDLNEPVTCGMNLFLIRFNKQVNQRYMYYCLKNYEQFIKSLAHGTTTKTITKDDVRNLKLPIHTDIREQDKISSLLTSIDKKIEINNKINDNLASQAYRIYMHSFYSKDTNGKIEDIILENKKSSIQVNAAKGSQGPYPFFTSGDAIFNWSDYLVDGRNILMNTGGNADVKFYVGKLAYSTDTWCISAKNNLEDYLFWLLTSIKEELNLKYFQGTGLKHMQKPLLKSRTIYIPTDDELFIFNNQIKPMMSKISANTHENQQLSYLRDWLLPLLMNGQAKIRD